MSKWNNLIKYLFKFKLFRLIWQFKLDIKRIYYNIKFSIFPLSERKNNKNKVFQDYNQENWSKCPFCGARNGLFGRPLNQHTTRCLYKGNANSTNVSVPNYDQYIKEDDLKYLPAIKDQYELVSVKKELIKAQKEIEALKNKTN